MTIGPIQAFVIGFPTNDRFEGRIAEAAEPEVAVPDVADERADTDAEADEVEKRLEEAGEEDHPDPPVHHHVPLDDQEPAYARPGRCGERGAGDVFRHQRRSLRR